jgi:hypothetical protein
MPPHRENGEAYPPLREARGRMKSALPLLRFAAVCLFRLVSMGHRVKPGGDEMRSAS